MTKPSGLPEPGAAGAGASEGKSPLVPIVAGLVAAGAVACGVLYFWLSSGKGVGPQPKNEVAKGFTAMAEAKRLAAEAGELLDRADKTAEKAKKAKADAAAETEADKARKKADEAAELEKSAAADRSAAAAKAKEAAAKCDEVLAAVGPKHPFGLSARVIQGMAARLNGDLEGSLKILDALLTEDTFKALGTLAGTGKDLEESSTLAAAHLERALTLAKAGRHKEGIEALRKLEDLKGLAYNTTHVVRMGMADVYEKVGEYDQARAVYERIIERHEGPEKSWAKQASMRIKLLDMRNPPAKPADDPKAKKVSGILDGKHFWTKDESPYQVGETVKVATGARLEIGPGVVVRFAPGARLEVLGTLVAQGGQGEAGEIRFTAVSDKRGAFGWEGIELNGGASTLARCRVDSARVGLRVRGGTPEITDCRVTNCGKAGIQIRVAADGTATPVVPTLARCVVDRNLGTGIDMQGAVAPKLIDCTLEANGEFGVAAQDAAAPELSGCRVIGNREDGVLFHKTAKGRIAGKTVIEGNGGFGLKTDLHGEADATSVAIKGNGAGGVSIAGTRAALTDCTVEANAGPGVVVGLGSSAALSGNTILGNAKAGVVADNGAKKPEIRNNRISGQPIGLLIRDVVGAVIAGNDLSGNKELALSCESENSLDARDNYWGAADADAIRKLIKGPVKFEPFRTAP